MTSYVPVVKDVAEGEEVTVHNDAIGLEIEHHAVESESPGIGGDTEVEHYTRVKYLKPV